MEPKTITNTTWKTEKWIAPLDSNICVIITDNTFQEKFDIETTKIGGKWSKNYDAKCKEPWAFKDNKMLLANVHPNLIQQLKNIDKYKYAVKDQDLTKTLFFVRDIYFSGRDGGLTFQPMICLEQCEQTSC